VDNPIWRPLHIGYRLPDLSFVCDRFRGPHQPHRGSYCQPNRRFGTSASVSFGRSFRSSSSTPGYGRSRLSTMVACCEYWHRTGLSSTGCSSTTWNAFSSWSTTPRPTPRSLSRLAPAMRHRIALHGRGRPRSAGRRRWRHALIRLSRSRISSRARATSSPVRPRARSGRTRASPTTRCLFMAVSAWARPT